ncbi:MAG: response regulator, partial [Alphaproteobacteria bacterium]
MTPRILIVDDQPLNVKLLDAKLTAEYYEFVGATNGEEALAKAAEVVPDLILLDVMMPGMGGYEVCKCLKADPFLRRIPVVMVTALGDPADRIRGIDAGA